MRSAMAYLFIKALRILETVSLLIVCIVLLQIELLRLEIFYLAFALL